MCRRVYTGPVRDRTRDHYRKVGIQRREREKRKDRNGVRERERERREKYGGRNLHVYGRDEVAHGWTMEITTDWKSVLIS